MAHTSHHAEAHAGGHAPLPQGKTARQLTEDVLERMRMARERTGAPLLIASVLSVAGLVGILLKLSHGFGDRAAWGYYAAIVGWLLSTACSAPIIVIVTRLARGDWRRPFTRIGDIYAFTPAIMLLLVTPVMLALPPLEGRRNLYMNWPGAPHVYIFLAFLGLAIIGPLLAYLATLPDMATLRDNDEGSGEFARSRASYWIGSVRQWAVHRSGLVFLAGPLYFIMLGGVQLIYATDFSMSLIPGWMDAVYPAYVGVTGLQAGMATLIISMYVVRKAGHLENYITRDHFWTLSKILLPLSLMWFYFFWSAFIIMWYGKKPNEQAVMALLVGWPPGITQGMLGLGPGFPFFALSALCNFILPFVIMVWNPVRYSIIGPTIVSVIIVFGNLMDRIRLYTSAFSIPNEWVQLHELELDKVLEHHLPTPDMADWLLFAGAFGLFGFILLTASRVVPMLSVWENKEGLLYRVVRPFHHGHVTVVGKPD